MEDNTQGTTTPNVETPQSQPETQTGNQNGQTTQNGQPDMTAFFQKAYNEGKTAAEKQLEKTLSQHGISKEDFALLAELKANKAELEKQNLIKKGDYEALIEKERKTYSEQLKVKDELLSQRERAIHDLTIETDIISQANKYNAYDVTDISNALKTLYDIRFDFETKTKQVLTKSGERVINTKTGNPITIEEAILQLRETKPHLFKGNGFSGAGTLPTQNGQSQNKNIENMSLSELKKHIEQTKRKQ